MALDDTASLKQATLAQLGSFERLARQRFRDETLAQEAVDYVLDKLQEDAWRRVRAHRGTARLETYLQTVAARLLEDFARRRFGRVRVPDASIAARHCPPGRVPSPPSRSTTRPGASGASHS